MSTAARDRVLRSAGAALLGALWVGLGLLVGWFAGYLADQLALPAHHALIYAALALSAAVLVAWAYGTRLLYLEVRAGLDEARDGEQVRRRTGYAWTAALAGPIVGLLIGWSSHSAPHAAPAPSPAMRPVAAVAARPSPSRTRGGLAAASAEVAATSRLRAAPGDTLPAIADRLYGSPAEWPRLAAANAGRLDRESGARLVDPSLLPLGMEVALPPPAPGDGAGRAGASAGEAAPAPSAGASTRAAEIFAALAGLGLLGAAMLAARLARLRRYQAMRAASGSSPPRLSPADAALEASIRPLRLAELPWWIDAANRLLAHRLGCDPAVEPPRVSVLRAGPHGIELLLDEARPLAPAGFIATDDGRCWRLDPALELDELRAATAGAEPYLAVLVPVAEDDDGSYLVACGPGESLAVRGEPAVTALALGAIRAHLASAPWSEVACYRVGACSFVGGAELLELTVDAVAGIDTVARRAPLWRAGVPDCQPVVLVEDPVLATAVRERAPGIVAVIGTMPEADRLLCYEAGSVTVEPLGLCLPALLASTCELEAVARLTAAAAAVPAAVPGSAVPGSAVPGSAVPGSGEDRDGDPPALVLPALPTAGAVELRLLRPLPDLVGELRLDPGDGAVHPEVVQLVAYLALHRYRATTSKLRDVFGRYKRDASRASRTIWNATSRARSVLGPERFPPAHGSRPYTLDATVSCDWLRCKEIVAAGRALAAAGRVSDAIEALRLALELVGDGYPCSEDSIAARYEWLDAEQILVEIEGTVVAAAHLMATLCLEQRPAHDCLDDAAWAIGRGRVISPESLPLREAALRLAAARQDERAIEAEFLAAVEAVDDLELGFDVDPSLEAAYHRLGQR